MRAVSRVRLDKVYEAIRNDPNFTHLKWNGAGPNPLIEGEGDNPIAFIVGEAPGATEVKAKRPFVGESGTILRELMAHAGLYATGVDNKTDWVATEWNPNCWLTNAVKYRPSLSNRTPTYQELMDSRKHLRREWLAVGKPDIIITIGSAPLTAVMGRKQSILAKAGRMFSNYNSERDPQTMVFWPMIHPAFGLRNPPIRPTIEAHWERLREWLANHPRYQHE